MKGMRIHHANFLKAIQDSRQTEESIAGKAGVSVQTFSYIKNGKKGTTYPTLKAIAKELGVLVDVLIDNAPDMTKKEIHWHRVMHEAALMGLTDFIDGQIASLEQRIKEKNTPERCSRGDRNSPHKTKTLLYAIVDGSTTRTKRGHKRSGIKKGDVSHCHTENAPDLVDEDESVSHVIFLPFCRERERERERESKPR